MMNAYDTAIPRSRAVPAGGSRQLGVVLFIALIVLVAMTLAGIALWRSVGTGVLIAGNLAFQQGATSSADRGLEGGRAWLVAQNETTLRNDQVPGYFANWQANFNPRTFDWAAQGTAMGTDAAGYAVDYVIHRLCRNSGLSPNAPTQQCSTIMASGAGVSKQGAAYGTQPLVGTVQPYYRVTVRVTGPKNSVSYVQAIMY